MDLKELIRKASPIILTGLAVFGVGATAYTSVRANKEVLEELDNHKVVFSNSEDGSISSVEITEKEKAKIYIRHYYKPILIGAGTVLCILGATTLSKKNQATLASAYALLERTHKEYVGKVKDIFGTEGHQKIMDAIALDHCEAPHLYSPGLLDSSSLDTPLEENYHVFYDTFSKRYFESTMPAVLEAEYHLNRNYTMSGIISVNEWYEFLGLDPIDLGDDYVWYGDDGLYWIDFDHHVFTTGDLPEHLYKEGEKKINVIAIDFVYCPCLASNSYD